MKNVTVIGAQWGDEGKGKIVDWLSEKADVVVRFQGGHNAGHTLVVNDVEYKLSLLPSGIVRKNKLSIIGNGVVIDPWALFSEIETVSAKGIEISPENLKISETAILILPFHGELDRARESSRKYLKIGTTGRGIGPAYEDKVGRRALRVCDLFDNNILEHKLDELLVHHNILRKGFDLPAIQKNELLDKLKEVSHKIKPFVSPVWKILDDSKREGKKILFEGAQAVMLDVDHGTYPYVTSSNTVPGQVSIGAGVGLKTVGTVLGIAKAYTTRVGTGPFPTELSDEIGEKISQLGKEFGTVTGRKRRCGWFDAVMTNQAIKLSGIDGIVLTKLDILDSFEEIKICTGYIIDGEKIEYFPPDLNLQSKIIPVYETLPGWKESTRSARTWKDLPANAIKYVRRIEELIECPIHLLSTSPKREDTIMVKDPFLS